MLDLRDGHLVAVQALGFSVARLHIFSSFVVAVVVDMTSPASRPDQQCVSEYFLLLQLSEQELDAQGCSKMEVGGLEAFSRWADSRARHHEWGSRHKQGHAPGTHSALLAAQSQYFLCLRPGCQMLVQLQRARQQARAAGRSTLAAGDGCGNRCCTKGHMRPLRLAAHQRDVAASLLNGKRVLVLPPPSSEARINLWMVPPALARSIASSVLATSAASTLAASALASSTLAASVAAALSVASAALDASARVRIARMRARKAARRLALAAASSAASSLTASTLATSASTLTVASAGDDPASSSVSSLGAASALALGARGQALRLGGGGSTDEATARRMSPGMSWGGLQAEFEAIRHEAFPDPDARISPVPARFPASLYWARVKTISFVKHEAGDMHRCRLLAEFVVAFRKNAAQ